MKRTLILSHQIARQRAIDAVREAPEGYVITISEPTRNAEQNAMLHATIGEIAATQEWAGKKRDAEVWKRLLVAAWSRATNEPVQYLPALDGQGIDIVWRRTSEMTQREVRDLLGFIEAWEAETEPTERQA